MMMMGMSELLLIALMLGNPGLPLGVPPAAEDPLMFRVAPENCLYYATWAGVGTPDPASGNSTERMLAQKEIQDALVKIDTIATQLSAQLSQQDEPIAQAMGALAPTLVRSMLTRPTAFYVAEAKLGPAGVIADAALVINAEGQEEALLAALGSLIQPEIVEEYEFLVEQEVIGDLEFTKVSFGENQPMVPPIYWGRRGRYVVLGLGEGSVQNVFAQSETDPPQWLTELRESMPVERTSSVCRVDLAGLLELGAVAMDPMMQALIEDQKLDRLVSYNSVTGLNERGFEIRSRINTDGPIPLLSLLSDQPLMVDDLQLLPENAPVAFATKFDAEATLETAASLSATLFGPGQDFDQVKDEMSEGVEQILGVSLDRLLNKIFDDTAYVYASPTDGGILTGWTAVIRLKNPMQAQQCAQHFSGFMNAIIRNNNRTKLRSEDVGDFTVTSFEVIDNDFPVIPTWSVSDSEFVIGLFPGSVKTHLSRSQGEAEDSVVVAPFFQQRFTETDPMKGEGPRALIKVDQAEVIRTVYPVAQIMASMAMNEIDEESGINLSPTDWPSVAALTRETNPMFGVWEVDDNGLEWRVEQTIPIGDAVTSAPMLGAMTLPGIAAARVAARRTQSANNIKMIAISLHNFHDTFKGFPAAYSASEDGTPLLSWRVQMLPYMGYQQLYEQFHLDEPWDSEHNKKLIEQMPMEYATPGNDASEGLTNYLGVAGKNRMFQSPNERDFGEVNPRGIGFRNVVDGTSNTIMLVEVNNDHRVVWTAPEDFEAPGMEPVARMAGLWKLGFHAGMADGSVQMLPLDIDEKALSNLFQINDGEYVEIPRIR